MGQTLPTIAVKRFTGVEQEQIKQTFGVLCNRSGTTKINQPTFIQYWADYVDPIIADRLWLIFDTKFDSFLDFEEWSTGLATTVRGNKEDRVKLIGNIFDIDNHGYVTEATARKLFATNLFAARNIIKPFDWEAYEAAQLSTGQAQIFVKALYDYTGSNDMELTFTAGTTMQLLEKVDSDWWWCDLNDKQGYAPANYVEVVKAPAKSKQSKFATVKRGTEVEALMMSLMKVANKEMNNKIRKDAFMQWALEHEMDLCLNVLEKVDLRANKPVTIMPAPDQPAPAPPATTKTGTLAAAPVTAAPTPTNTNTPAQVPEKEVTPEGVEVPATALRPEGTGTGPKISPELATILRAAGIADKELDDNAMSEFIEYFIEKHAPKTGTNATAGRRRKVRDSRIAGDSVHSRPLPSPASTSAADTAAPAPPAPAPPTVVVTPAADTPDDAVTTRPSLHEQIKAGKKLKASKKKTNLATLSKKDLTGLGLLLRVQIDSRRNFIAMSDDDDSSNSDFDD